MTVANPNAPENRDPDNRRVSIFHPEPDLGILESAYRQNILHADVDQIRLIVSIYVGVVLIYAIIDYQLFGLSTLLFALYVARGIFVVLSALLILGLRRIKKYQLIDRLVLIWAVTGVGLTLFINFTRANSFFYNAPVDLMILMSIYIALPSPFYHRLIPALIFSVGEIALFLYFRSGVSPVGVRSVILAFLAGNIIGLLTSIRLYAYRRNQYKAQHQEQLARQELERLATTDSLTQLANRHRFMEVIHQEFERFRRSQAPFCLLSIDLDHFKHINDTSGHAIGDTVLKQFGVLASSQIRQIDLVGRLGGEEFAILLVETRLEQALDVANRIRELCEQAALQTPASKIQLTTSIGVAEVQEGDASVDEIFLRSDQALYRAKQNGRNQVSL